MQRVRLQRRQRVRSRLSLDATDRVHEPVSRLAAATGHPTVDSLMAEDLEQAFVAAEELGLEQSLARSTKRESIGRHPCVRTYEHLLSHASYLPPNLV